MNNNFLIMCMLQRVANITFPFPVEMIEREIYSYYY